LLQPIVVAINRSIEGEISTKQLIEDIFTYVKEAEKDDKETREQTEAQAKTSALHQVIRKDLFEMHESLAARINSIMDTTNVILETTEKTLKAAEDLKGGTKDLISKVGNVTSVADKIASTTQSY